MSLHRIEQVTTYSAPTEATMRGRLLFGAYTAIPVFLTMARSIRSRLPFLMPPSIADSSCDECATARRYRHRAEDVPPERRNQSGELLLEAQAQQEYRDFLQWVEGHFDGSFSTAYNHAAAAKLATRFPAVGNLRLRASALYTLGLGIEGGRWDQAVIDTLFAEAEVTCINADRAREIWDLHNKTGEDETEEEKAAKEEPADRDRVIAEIQRAKEAVAAKARATQKEAEAIPGGPPPVLPPAQTAQDKDVAAFEQFIDIGMMLTTKPGDKFNDRTARKSKDIVAVCDFLRGRLQKVAHLQSVANFAKLRARKKENC